MRICEVDGCETPVRYKDWCVKHFRRWEAHGDPTAILTNRGKPLEERFLARVMAEPMTGCWIWTGGRGGGGYRKADDSSGYGRFDVTHSQLVPSHRWAYEHWVGPIPDGMQPDHLCKVTLCVSPWHLEAVTPRENLMRGDTYARANAAKTHCPRGHAYDEVNTRVYRGSRSCRACARIERRQRRRRPVA